MSEEKEEYVYDPFHNVRPGGPKETRLFRVALMGEYNSIKPTYWIRLVQNEGDPLIDNKTYHEIFKQHGEILKLYRPVNVDTQEPQLFTFVGFSKEDVPERMKELYPDGIVIDGITAEVVPTKKWFAELYSDPNLSFFESLTPT